MKCYIVEDLLPEYIEDLCSPETAAEIDAHLETCEHCKKMLDEMKHDEESLEGSVPVGAEDIKPFQKVKKKMKRERIKKIVAIVALVVVCGFFGMLTVSQMFPTLSLPNYDSLMYRYKGWKIAKQFVEGDMETVLGGTNRNLTMGFIAERGDVFSHSVTTLRELHKEVFLNKEVDIHIEGVTYEGAEYTYDPEVFEGEHGYYVEFKLDVEGMPVSMMIYFDSRNTYGFYIWPDDSLYYCGSAVPSSTFSDSDQCNIIKMDLIIRFFRYLSEKDSTEEIITNSRISSLGKDYLPEDSNYVSGFVSYLTNDCNELVPCVEGDVHTAYQIEVGNNLAKIAPHLASNTFTLSNGDYNRSEHKYNATLYWTLTDLKGKSCIMTKAFYYGPMGYEAVDNTEKIYADEGFDKDILKNLEKIFDKS